MEKIKDKIRVAIIGYGHLGKWHCQKMAMIPGAQLSHIVETSDDHLRLAREYHPQVKCSKKLEEIVDEVDACVVVTPTSTHYPLLRYLVEKGKHVFCEKPICDSWADALKLRELLASRPPGQVIQVGHSERFHGAWEKWGEFAAFLKVPSLIRMERVAPFKGRATDVDVVSDLMIHDLDLLVHLFREVPVSIASVGFKVLTDKWDFVCSDLNFHSGHKARITVHRNDVKEVRSMEVTNELGHLKVDLLNQQILFASPGKEIRKIELTRRDHLLLEQECFIKSIQNGGPPVVSAEDGLLAVKLVAKVLESLESKKPVYLQP